MHPEFIYPLTFLDGIGFPSLASSENTEWAGPSFIVKVNDRYFEYSLAELRNGETFTQGLISSPTTSIAFDGCECKIENIDAGFSVLKTSYFSPDGVSISSEFAGVEIDLKDKILKIDDSKFDGYFLFSIIIKKEKISNE